MVFCIPAVGIFTVAWIQSREENEGLYNAMFTLKFFKRRDYLHVGRRVGVDDARVHLPVRGKLAQPSPVMGPSTSFI